ncbi:Magnesium transporter MgtE [Methylobacterium cerastii]|uniref:Magnesium transporter MgtE n=1 Tax=Methylobacterium cerastii TaxID=932741 RepID=A0ABQ4QJJ3_9HYPH|nr:MULTISPECIES: magnesium transporter [Methylobacterium]TXM67820.1 magnesium transporter [Methylobacterium sp. WL120]TXM69324.1 magnesium transporter [Methylobacterium sp. WL12]TXM90822.1 magnesium transporter [Methylobacterium sp. WL103]TXN81006.1 magnesium transporter [Methylobacterium sp. WL8]GJD45332.1 Magnesium transporter MgtE [Methylobacterium cerastii]
MVQQVSRPPVPDAVAPIDPRVDPSVLAARLSDERAPDIVEALNAEAPEVAAAILLGLPHDRAIEVLDQPELDDAADIIEMLPRDRVATFLSGMSADRVTDVFREIEEPGRSDLRARLDAETRGAVDRLSAYGEETVGSLMTTEFVTVPGTWTVAQTLDHVRSVEKTRETIYAIFVLDPRTRALTKAVPLRRLISGNPDDNVLSVAAGRRPLAVSPTASREEAARLISKYDLLALPVVDAVGHLIGIVTVDDMIDAMVEKQTQDVQRFGGMEALPEPYMDIGFMTMIRKRAGWLCALFLSEMLTASAMQGFEGELEKAIVLTLFIPLIMSSGGNSGSQATSLLIRALALHQISLRDWWRVALRELPTGLVLGAILGVIAVVRIAIWQKTGLYDYGEHWPLVAATVGGALVGIVTFGSLSGSMLPFLLQRLGFDPATASAPFVATLVDVTGLVIYFSVALLILRGTLL